MKGTWNTVHSQRANVVSHAEALDADAVQEGKVDSLMEQVRFRKKPCSSKKQRGIYKMQQTVSKQLAWAQNEGAMIKDVAPISGFLGSGRRTRRGPTVVRSARSVLRRRGIRLRAQHCR